jgi:hypothetical protein
MGGASANNLNDLKRKRNVGGYVGIGKVTSGSVAVRDFRYNGIRLERRILKGPDLLHDADDAERCEYLVGVKWIKTVPREQARFRRRSGLYTTQLIVASLSRQPKTLRFLEQEFNLSFDRLLTVGRRARE